MQTFIMAAQLLLDLLVLPFLLGVITAAVVLRLRRKTRVLRHALLTGALAALVHAAGVLLMLWKDGDWLAYLMMLIVVSIVIALRS